MGHMRGENHGNRSTLFPLDSVEPKCSTACAYADDMIFERTHLRMTYAMLLSIPPPDTGYCHMSSLIMVEDARTLVVLYFCTSANEIEFTPVHWLAGCYGHCGCHDAQTNTWHAPI